jgi:hypothetical protein
MSIVSQSEDTYPVQRRSKQLTRSMVSAMLKETSCVSGDDRIERLSHGFN